MTTYDSIESLSGMRREAVVDLLYRMADDELLVGHRDAEWTSLALIPEEGAALTKIAQDEMGHARAYYEILHELGGPEPAVAAFSRGPRQFRCSSLVCLPEQDWTFSVIRQFLYDVQENVRLTALSESTFAPLAHLAREHLPVERKHLSQGRSWILRLGQSTGEKRRRMQDALTFAYPHALGLFEPTEADEPLAQSGICSPEEQLRREWESALVPVLSGAGLDVPDNARPVHGGRVGQHLPTFSQLLSDLQLAHKDDTTGQW